MCRELFERLDTDKSGGIDMREFTEGLKQQGYSLSAEEIEQIMDRIDINADKMIVFDELAASLLDWKSVSPAGPFHQTCSIFEYDPCPANPRSSCIPLEQPSQACLVDCLSSILLNGSCHQLYASQAVT